jgi:hypothetical protein
MDGRVSRDVRDPERERNGRTSGAAELALAIPSFR